MQEEEKRALRNCLGSFATGVTIVTCIDEQGEPQGVTANSFSSVSLEPPLVLWSIAHSSSTFAQFMAAQTFAINVLTQSQQDLSNHFAKTGQGLFEGKSYHAAQNGAPLFADALATFECTQEQVYEAGDHHIIIGRVTHFSSHAGSPLVFQGGQYRRLAEN